MTNTLVELMPNAVFKTECGMYVIVGKTVDPGAHEELQGRVGEDEVAIRISADLIRKAIAVASTANGCFGSFIGGGGNGGGNTGGGTGGNGS